MAKKFTAKDLQTATARARLAPQHKPYKVTLLRGVHLGLYVPRNGTASWLVIAADGKGGQWERVFGRPDTAKLPADGSAVFSYEQACNKARAIARGDSNASAEAPATIAEALDSYKADLTGGGRNPYNARWVLAHLPQHLAAQPLSQITSKQLRSWRDGLIKSGVLSATINRMLKGAHAAFNLAAKLDKRVSANAQAWKVGLEALRNTVKAREAVLDDREVLAVVSAAYEIDWHFGVYVQAHAETGARSSQLVPNPEGPGCLVRDLVEVTHKHTGKPTGKFKLSVPASRKGRDGGRGAQGGYVNVPLTASLAERLRTMAAGRAADAPLFIHSDGMPWKAKRSFQHGRPFKRAARAAGLPADTTVYSLRHSSIVRQLKVLPIKVVADYHDTSTQIIERHYGKFLGKHTDDMVRAVLLDTTPPVEQGDKVVKLRS